MPLQATSGAASYDAFGGGALAVAPLAEAIEFDGTNDFLSRSSDLTGNADGKTFTFSAWCYLTSDSNNGTSIYSSDIGFRIEVSTSQVAYAARLYVNAFDQRLWIIRDDLLQYNTWFHLLISVDLSNTANRYVYINDLPATVSYDRYVNTNIDFTSANHVIANNYEKNNAMKGRLAHVFLDYAYRNLSVDANRRLFVTANLKPALGQAALNPIMYLPMSDPTQPGLNQGTGGNFTLTGTVARSGRGPNQYNAPYSDLDGAADYLSSAGISGIADGNQFTLVFSYKPDVIGGTAQTPICFSSSSSVRFDFYVDTDGSAYLRAFNSAATRILQATFAANTFVAGRNYVVACSINLSSTSTRHVYINGLSVSPTWTNYTNGTIQFNIATTPRYRVGANQTPSSYVNGGLGALWFNTSYIDLSVAANLAKFVTGTGIDAKPVDLGATGELPTGTSPLIYLPMYSNDAGRNYGTGGNFTVNSGPYTGARGPNEFWGNLADFNGTTGYLARIGGLTGISDSKVFSCSFVYDPDVSGTDQEIINIQGDTHVFGFRIYRDGSDNKLNFVAQNSSNVTILSAVTSGTFTTARYFIQACFDLNNSSNRAVYVNGTLQTMTYSTYTNDTADLTRNRAVLAARFDGSYGRFLDGQLSEFYFATNYIDFTQEAERLKFRDCFGNPTDLPSAITAQSVPTPAIYMRFPPTSFGTNSGTGGDFTVNGTITDGGQL
jgi:hypothetical protein